MPPYPARPRCWIAHFTRALFRSGAAADLGPSGVTLLLYVVSREDAAHYRGPVSLFAEDMPAALGISATTIKQARTAAVKAGWLAYLPGARGKAARYYVTVPADVATDADPSPAVVALPQPEPGQAAGDIPGGIRPVSRPSSDRVAPALIPPEDQEEECVSRACGGACDPPTPDADPEPAVLALPRAEDYASLWNALGLRHTDASSIRRLFNSRVLIDPWFRKHWPAVLARAAKSRFLRGEVTDWAATADWIFKEPETARLVFHGKYDAAQPRDSPREDRHATRDGQLRRGHGPAPNPSRVEPLASDYAGAPRVRV